MKAQHTCHCEEQQSLWVGATWPSRGLLWLVLLLFIFQPAFAQTKRKNLDKWLGTYSYTEDFIKGNGGDNLMMGWELIITKSENGYSGKLSIDGYQTFIEDLTDIVGDEKAIAIKFVKQTDGQVYEYNNPPQGELLFTLKRANGKLITQWANMEPRLHEKQPKECRCFVLEKRR